MYYESSKYSRPPFEFVYSTFIVYFLHNFTPFGLNWFHGGTILSTIYCIISINCVFPRLSSVSPVIVLNLTDSLISILTDPIYQSRPLCDCSFIPTLPGYQILNNHSKQRNTTYPSTYENWRAESEEQGTDGRDSETIMTKQLITG